MVDIDKIVDGVITYAEQQIMPHLDKRSQFVMGMAMGILAGKNEEILKGIAENEAMKALGLISGRNVDLEKLYAAAKQQIRKQKDFPLDVPMIGRLTIGEADIDDLYHTIMQ